MTMRAIAESGHLSTKRNWQMDMQNM
ncbi:hypothetical protein A2U01_0049880, partial [Trifolium medium]|nr:hypothetical protein [Trifolium medium]